MLKIPQNIHNNIFCIALIICAFALSLSIFLISLCQIVLLINWLIQEPLKERWQKIKNCKPLWFITLYYFIHILWLTNTTVFLYAQYDLRIKLPLLILPIIISTSEPISFKWLRLILLSFITGVLISSIYSACKIFSLHGDVMSQMSVISPFVWHIRLAIMAVFAVFIIPWLYIKEKKHLLKIIYILVFIWLIIFQFILQSLTGIFVLFILSFLFVVIATYRLKSILIRWTLALTVVVAFLIFSSFILHTYTKNFAPLPIKISSLEKITANGNPYQNEIDPPYLENGNYVNLYICNEELNKEWSKRSKYGIDSTDTNNNKIRNTLIRYLTSKNLRKDSSGIAQLSDNDIHYIEMGIANSIYTQKMGLTSRVYRLMWELYHYSKGANPSGLSVSLRIEYFKTAVKIIRRNFWYGTGTGDVLQEFNKQYEIDNSSLTQRWRLRAHNQFLTFFLTFGVFGFIAIILSIFVPPYIAGKFKNYLFAVFFVIFILSMFTIDTLETHAGISFIALFYSVLIFSKESLNDT